MLPRDETHHSVASLTEPKRGGWRLQMRVAVFSRLVLVTAATCGLLVVVVPYPFSDLAVPLALRPYHCYLLTYLLTYLPTDARAVL